MKDNLASTAQTTKAKFSGRIGRKETITGKPTYRDVVMRQGEAG